MSLLYVIVTMLLTESYARIIESRDPKVDPLTLDNILSQIVENSMDEMRFRLRQAIYTMALKKIDVPRFMQSDGGLLENYEERLLDHFIAQISGSFTDGSRPNTRGHRSQSALTELRGGVRLLEPYSDDDRHDSHKMTIALETYTDQPVKEISGKLITANDLRMHDSPASSVEGSTEKPRPLLFRLPLRQLLLAIIPSAVFLLLIALTLILWFRSRRRRTAFLKRRPNPFMISGAHTLPDFTNTPQSFLERLNRQQPMGTVVRERDHCEVWTRPPTATTLLESLQRV